MPRPRHVPIEGSERDAVEGARRVRRAPPDERVEVTVVVRPQSAPHLRVLPTAGDAAQARAGGVSFTPVQVAKLYDYPAGLDGSGQKVALIELGGGYKPADLKAYFTRLGIKQPKVTSVSI